MQNGNYQTASIATPPAGATLGADIAARPWQEIVIILDGLIAQSDGDWRDLLSDWRRYLVLLNAERDQNNWRSLLQKRPNWAGWDGKGLPPDYRG